MKIGVLTTSYPRYENDIAGCFVRDLNLAFVERGHCVKVLVPEPSHPRTLRDLPQIEVRPVAYIRPQRFQRSFYGPGAPYKLKRSVIALAGAASFVPALAAKAALELRDCDALISHWALPCGAIGAAIADGRPHIALCHSADVHLLSKLPLRKIVARSIAKKSCALWFVSEELRISFTKLLDERGPQTPVKVGPIGTPSVAKITAEFRQGLRRQFNMQQFTLLYLGRLVPIKGVDLLIRAVTQLPNIHLRIAGDGPERARLEHMTAPLGDRVRFEGIVGGDKKSGLLHAADALVVPSRRETSGRREGLPTVVIEAMMHGLPTIVSDEGGMKEVVQHGVDGFVFESGVEKSLQEAIERICYDPNVRESLASKAYTAAQRFSIDKTAAAMQCLIDA